MIERVVDELCAAANRDEEVPTENAPGVDLDARELVLARVNLSEPGEKGGW